MEQRNNDALNGGERVRLNLKRRNSIHCAAFIIGATPAAPNESNKRRRSKGGSNQSNGPHFRRSLLTGCSNFKRSGVPKRLMFYQNGEWVDFPKELFDLVKKDLQEKKAAMDVKLDGRHYLLDFLRMHWLDLDSGLRQPMAWIDEADKCFFPEACANGDEACMNGQLYADGGNGEASSSEPREIKLRLEIEINCSDESGSEEHNAPASNPGDAVAEDSSNRQTRNGLDPDDVRRMFLEGMSSVGNPEILSLTRCSSSLLQTRLELFEKQIEITRAYRGDANVQYAWLASSEHEVNKILMYGLGHCGPSVMRSAFGFGIHLTLARHAHASAKYCRVDVNGARRMILCRVILGSLEAIQRGSRQFHPSSMDYDVGVDNLQNPKHYVVWNADSNTHIYPEYVVTFKMPSCNMNEGHPVGTAANRDASWALTLALPGSQGRGRGRGQLQSLAGSSAAVTGNECCAGRESSPSPNTASPWMPFPVLFNAFAADIPLRDMEVITENYCLFQARRMTRDDFIKLLRSIVGDNLLRSTLSRLQAANYKICKHCECTKAGP